MNPLACAILTTFAHDLSDFPEKRAKDSRDSRKSFCANLMTFAHDVTRSARVVSGGAQHRGFPAASEAEPAVLRTAAK